MTQDALDALKEDLKRAFVAGCCAVLTWTRSGMPQDDLNEAGYDYAASVMGGDIYPGETARLIKEMGIRAARLMGQLHLEADFNDCLLDELDESE